MTPQDSMAGYYEHETTSLGPLLIDNLPFAITNHTDVYRGRLVKDNMRVVIKALRIKSLSQSCQMKFKEKLEREMDVWRTVSSHPHIVDFIGLTSTGSGLPAILSPEYGHGNANEYLARYPHADIFHLLSGVATGLQYLHGRKPPIIHGKLRGSNILISDEGLPLLSDLGMRNLAFPADLTIMNGNDNMDDVRWMAPELVDAPPNAPSDDPFAITCASDVHSFGMTTLELITQKPPFSDRRRAPAVVRDLVAGVRPPRPQCTKMSDDAWELITKCWGHEPYTRPNMDVVVSWLGVLFLSSRGIEQLAIIPSISVFETVK